MKNTPEISILMCVYNTDEEWLENSIKSILLQTFNDFEFIIVVDCPTDGCERVIYDYAKTDSRIVVINNTTNLGLTKSLNVALEHAQGRFIARMDSDDIAIGDRLEKQHDYMLKNESVVAVGSYIAAFGNNVITRGMNYFSDDYERERIHLLFANAGLAHPTAFIRKDFLDANKIRYDERFQKSQDYALWVDITEKQGKLAMLEEILLLYRVSENQISKRSSKEQSECCMRIVNEQLINLVNATEDELKLHCDLYDMKYKHDMIECQNYLKKLIAANNEKGIYDKKMFKDEVYALWIRSAMHAIVKHGAVSYAFSSMFWKALFEYRPLRLFLNSLQKNKKYENMVSQAKNNIQEVQMQNIGGWL